MNLQPTPSAPADYRELIAFAQETLFDDSSRSVTRYVDNLRNKAIIDHLSAIDADAEMTEGRSSGDAHSFAGRADIARRSPQMLGIQLQYFIRDMRHEIGERQHNGLLNIGQSERMSAALDYLRSEALDMVKIRSVDELAR